MKEWFAGEASEASEARAHGKAGHGGALGGVDCFARVHQDELYVENGTWEGNLVFRSTNG